MKISAEEWKIIQRTVNKAGYTVYRSFRAGSDSHWSYKYQGKSYGVWDSEYETYLYLLKKIKADGYSTAT